MNLNQYYIVNFLDRNYDWKNMSLQDFLDEGNIPLTWEDFFESNKKVLNDISNNLEDEKKENKKIIIYPQINHTFRAFLPLDNVKVIVLAQDPYFNGSAVGLCFSVRPGNKINPSLKNIYKELKQSGYSPTEDGNLLHWKESGCLMLNTALTVEKGCADSHTSYWYDFTESVVKYIVKNTKNVVWLLMGSKAQYFEQFLTDNHYVICTSHPSPFSAHRATKNAPAFLGSNIFRQTNDYLGQHHGCKIKW